MGKLIDEVLGVIDIEEAFCGFIKQSEENEENKFMGATITFKQFWNAQKPHMSQEELDKILKLFIQVRHCFGSAFGRGKRKLYWKVATGRL